MTNVEVTISAGQKEVSSFRMIATLVIAAACSGLAIATVFQVTKPIIDRNNARELQAAVFKVVPGSASLQRLALRNGQLVAIPKSEVTTEEVIYAAYDENAAFVGYAIENQASGFQDIIRVLYGYNPQTKLVIGMEVLESRETPGLGDKIWKDDDFVNNFTALAVEPPITVVKDGRDADNEVDAITGATISSKAVVKIINLGNEKWLDLLPPPGGEPALIIEPDPSEDEPENAPDQAGGGEG